jgi:hypothetical protein
MAPFAQSWHGVEPVPFDVPQWISAAAPIVMIHAPRIPTLTTLRRLFMVTIPIWVEPIMRIAARRLLKSYNAGA